MGMEAEVDRHAMVVADKSRKEGMEVVPTTIPDPPRLVGVNSAVKTG